MSLIQFVKSKVFLKQLIYAFIAFLFFSFLVIQWLRISTNHNQQIEVPDLQKMSLEEVENILSNIDLKYVVIDSANYNPDFPAQSVIEHSPEAGQFVKENRKIYLTLNPSRYPKIETPNVLGKTKRQAMAELLAVGFKVDTAAVYVEDMAEDVVRGLLLNDNVLNSGDKIPQNSIIKLKLGDGKKGQLNFDELEVESGEEEIQF